MSAAASALPPSSSALSLALLGHPNSGKTALFNLLTGSRQKVANYAGVTVERKEGLLTTASGQRVRVLDLPGAYSLNALSADEAVTRDVITGQRAGEASPELLVCVVDATNLRMGLRMVLETKAMGLPMVLALNMSDAARRAGIAIDRAVLESELGMAVVETVGIQKGGAHELLAFLDGWRRVAADVGASAHAWQPQGIAQVLHTQQEARRILQLAVREPEGLARLDDRIDRVVLHPLWGMVLLAVAMFFMFQAVFSWAEVPMDWITAAFAALAEAANAHMAEGVLRSLLVDGIIAGAGGVLVFLPQILILFLFILALEDSGYLPRAAFLLDRVMGTVGLSGRSFIPLLSSFACAIPGIMAVRTIADRRTKWVTVFIAPLMTCSARLPVYTLLIGAFIPAKTVAGMSLPGLVLFGLYVMGILSAIAVAWVLKLWRGSSEPVQLMMELPDYHWPRAKDVAIGLWQRASIFLRNVGGIILALTIILWFLSTFPHAPAGFAGSPIEYSFAGRIGHALAGFFAPIGFNWQIVVALIPGLAAREVMVAALGTVYALSQTGDEVGTALAPMIAADWSFATGLSLLMWFVFAPQCLATLAVVRKEMGSWAMPVGMAVFLFTLAYGASWVTYRLALNFGGF